MMRSLTSCFVSFAHHFTFFSLMICKSKRSTPNYSPLVNIDKSSHFKHEMGKQMVRNHQSAGML